MGVESAGTTHERRCRDVCHDGRSSALEISLDRTVELELVSRLRAGDADAFDVVYAEYNARLFAFLARLARSRVTAEDLLEETWLRLVGHAGRLRADTQIGPRLFTAIAGWGAGVFSAGNGWWWVPIVGPTAGGVLGALLYDVCVGRSLPNRGVHL